VPEIKYIFDFDIFYLQEMCQDRTPSQVEEHLCVSVVNLVFLFSFFSVNKSHLEIFGILYLRNKVKRETFETQ
jgi:hypothetical protein